MNNTGSKLLAELCDPDRTITYGIVQPGKLHKDGVPIVRVNNFRENTLDIADVLSVEPDIESKYRRSRPQENDILVTLVGSIGQVAIAPSRIAGWNLARAVGLVPMRDRHHAEWIYYSLQTRGAQHFIQQHANTTVQATFNLKDLARLPIPYPDKSQRQSALRVLTALDHKIELNRRMNETLEAIARAIFRDWFVDFGPTRAKQEAGSGGAATGKAYGAGREPYLAPDLWALFPDRLDGEGKPEGWDERPLDQIANFLNGLALQKYPAGDESPSLPVIKIAELRNGVTSKSNRASYEVAEKYIIDDGDFLFSWSGSLLAKFWTEGKGALNQHLFKVTSDDFPAWFYAGWVHHHLEEFQRIAASKATTMGHIQRGHLKAAMTNCPSDSTLKAMGEVMEPLVKRTIHNDLENRTLAAIRDLLLPKLMSGEIRVAEAEELAKDAVPGGGPQLEAGAPP